MKFFSMFLLSAVITLKTPIVCAMDERTVVPTLKTPIVCAMDERTVVPTLKTPIVCAMDERTVVPTLKKPIVCAMDEQRPIDYAMDERTVVTKTPIVCAMDELTVVPTLKTPIDYAMDERTVVTKTPIVCAMDELTVVPTLKTPIDYAMDERTVVAKKNNFDILFWEFENLNGIIKDAVNEIPPDKQNGLFNLAKAIFIENSVCIDENSNYKLIFYKLLKCVKAIPDNLQPKDKQKILTAFLFTVLDPSIQPRYQTTVLDPSIQPRYQTLEYQISEFINKSLQDLERNAIFEILIGNPKFSDDPITTLKNLLRDKPETNVNTKNDNNDETPLHVVSRRGKTDIVKILLEHDANVDLHNMDDETPFVLACKNNHLEVARMLFERMSQQAKDILQHSLLEESYSSVMTIVNYTEARVSKIVNKNPILKIFNQIYCSYSNKQTGNGEEWIPILNFLIKDVKVPLNSFMDIGDKYAKILRSPLMLAAETGLTSLLNVLIEGGANVNLANDVGETALHIMCKKHRYNTCCSLPNNVFYKVIEVLLYYKATVNTTNNKGEKPLDIASDTRNSKRIDYVKPDYILIKYLTDASNI